MRGSNPDTCKYFFLLQNIQIGSGDHLSSYSVGAGGSSRAEVKNEWSYTSAPPIRLHLSTKKGHHRPKQRKGDTRFGTWNVRSLYRAGSLTAAARELARCKLDLVGVQEVNDIKHTVLHTAEQLVPEPSAFDFELVIEKL